MFDNLFTRYSSFAERCPDHSVVVSQVLGGSMIGSTFLFMGLIFVLRAGVYEKDRALLKERRLISKLIGYSLILCAISRFFDVFCIWYNYSMISGLLKDITGLLGLITIAKIPFIIRLLKRQLSLQEVKDKMHETNQKIEEIKQIGISITKNT